MQDNKPLEAAAHLERSLAIGPARSVVYSDLSDALDKLGQSERAIIMLQKAISQDPFDPIPQRSLIFRLIDLKRYAKAQSAMDRYSQIFPQDFFTREKYARAMETAGKTIRQ